MKHLRQTLLIPLGGTAYGLLEVLWRGHTHWTMLLLGGLCFYLMAQLSQLPLPLYLCAVPSAYLITALEFLTGCLLNLRLGWNIWDYSAQPLNLLGQICFPFLGFWYLLSVAGIPIAARLRQRLL